MLTGDREALRALYVRHGRLVYSLTLRIVRDQAVAEEVVQDAFLKVWDKAATYRADKAPVLTWLLRIARNRAIDVLRTRSPSRTPRPWDLEGEEEPDPPEALERSGMQAEVRQALDSLSPPQRRAVLLAFYQGKTHREIAAQLGEPLGTVKTRIRDALLKLREFLAQRSGQ